MDKHPDQEVLNPVYMVSHIKESKTDNTIDSTRIIHKIEDAENCNICRKANFFKNS